MEQIKKENIFCGFLRESFYKLIFSKGGNNETHT